MVFFVAFFISEMTIQSLLQKYGELLARVDRWFRHCQTVAPTQIACRSGCSACCRGLFDITLLDAWYMQAGYDKLPVQVKQSIVNRAELRLQQIKLRWPEFDHPFILNHRPEESWDRIMPDDDDSPCVFTGNDGLCLVYDYRPMTCRLHGLPMLDLTGEIVGEDWCTLNFSDSDPLQLKELAFDFISLFKDELVLFQEFTLQLYKQRFNELDTVIPAVPFLRRDNQEPD